jgi:hypothetical protein
VGVMQAEVVVVVTVVETSGQLSGYHDHELGLPAWHSAGNLVDMAPVSEPVVHELVRVHQPHDS